MRVDSWDVRLVEFAREVVGLSFTWGVTDCATLVRRTQSVLLGKDPWKGYAPNWTTKRGAVQASRKMGAVSEVRESCRSRVATSPSGANPCQHRLSAEGSKKSRAAPSSPSPS